MKKITKKLLLVVLALFATSPSCFGMDFEMKDPHENYCGLSEKREPEILSEEELKKHSEKSRRERMQLAAGLKRQKLNKELNSELVQVDNELDKYLEKISNNKKSLKQYRLNLELLKNSARVSFRDEINGKCVSATPFLEKQAKVLEDAELLGCIKNVVVSTYKRDVLEKLCDCNERSAIEKLFGLNKEKDELYGALFGRFQEADRLVGKHRYYLKKASFVRDCYDRAPALNNFEEFKKKNKGRNFANLFPNWDQK